MALYSNYSNFNNYNNQNYMRELQSMRDQIDRQMAQAQQTQQQIQQMQAAPQQPQITQTFQLGNTQQNMNDFDARYSDNVEDVKNTLVFKPSIFVTKDMSTLWLKDVGGNVKTYALSEIIEKDEKDVQIDNLKDQLEDMKAILMRQTEQIQQMQQTPTTKEVANELVSPKESSKSSKK